MNFFKHADKDPNGTIAFDPSLTEPFIMLSLLTLEDLGAQHTSEETAFFLWCALNNSDWLNEQGLAKFIHHLPVQHLAHLRLLLTTSAPNQGVHLTIGMAGDASRSATSRCTTGKARGQGQLLNGQCAYGIVNGEPMAL